MKGALDRIPKAETVTDLSHCIITTSTSLWRCLKIQVIYGNDVRKAFIRIGLTKLITLDRKST